MWREYARVGSRHRNMQTAMLCLKKKTECNLPPPIAVATPSGKLLQKCYRKADCMLSRVVGPTQRAGHGARRTQAEQAGSEAAGEKALAESAGAGASEPAG